MNVTVYKNLFETKKGYSITIFDALDRIKSGKSKDQVLELRKCKNKEDRDKKKRMLPSVLFAGSFSTRDIKGLQKASGFAILDFDDVPIEYKLELQENPFVFACWVSPSGNGIKALVKIPIVKTDKEYKEYYNALLAIFEKANIDKSTKDISRVCFESFDPDIYINTTSKTFKQKIEEKKVEVSRQVMSYASDDDTYNKLLVWINKQEIYSKGNRNNYINKLAYACNKFGLSKSTVLSNIKSQFDLSEKEIEQTVNSAYKDTSAFNTATFQTWDKIREVKEMIRSNTPMEEIKIVADDELIAEAQKSINRKVSTFWTVTEDEKILFHLEKFINWLEGDGFFKHLLNDGQFILIKITENIVKQIYRFDIRTYVFNYINSLPFEFDGILRGQLQQWFFNQEKKIISENVFELLSTKQIDFYKDKRDSAKLFYQNGIVAITKDNIQLEKYANFDGYIWEQQIIKRDFDVDAAKNITDYGMFDKFLKNIIGSPENLQSLHTALGYLVHSYKPTSFAPAIVLNDKVISDDPNGGTGKGILANAIGQFKNMVKLDGKTFDFKKSFAFQRIELSTDFLVFDDVKQNFDFEMLFSIITEGITVEKKNKGEFFIPFDKSPKILITTNYALKGEGNSIERRKVDFELEQYYNKNFTPQHEFGKMFFSEWDVKEWFQFDCLIVFCVIQYLQKGIILPLNENLQEKRLSANTNIEFLDYMNDFTDFNTILSKKDIFEEFTRQKNMKRLTPHTLTKWFKRWCEFHKYEYSEHRTGAERKFSINNNVNKLEI